MKKVKLPSGVLLEVSDVEAEKIANLKAAAYGLEQVEELEAMLLAEEAKMMAECEAKTFAGSMKKLSEAGSALSKQMLPASQLKMVKFTPFGKEEPVPSYPPMTYAASGYHQAPVQNPKPAVGPNGLRPGPARANVLQVSRKNEGPMYGPPAYLAELLINGDLTEDLYLAIHQGREVFVSLAEPGPRRKLEEHMTLGEIEESMAHLRARRAELEAEESPKAIEEDWPAQRFNLKIEGEESE